MCNYQDEREIKIKMLKIHFLNDDRFQCGPTFIDILAKDYALLVVIRI